MKIRSARVDDLAAIQNCARRAYAHFVDRIGREPAPMVADFADQIVKGIIHVVEDQRRVCGFIVLYPRGDHIHIENVAIDPAFQRHGLGTALLEFAEQQAHIHGRRAIELYTNEKMTENLEFYPRLGYVETGRSVEDGFSRVYFRKEL
jgi:ribosomal protein S18 acetylase RimI-like enzyme